MKPGIYSISSNEYHQSPGLSRSAIMTLRKSPLHFWSKYIAPSEEKNYASTATNLGNAVHTLVLEPHLFNSDFGIIPEGVHFTTTKGKAMRDEMLSAGKVIVKNEEFELAQKMQKSVIENAGFLLDGAQFEQSIYWMDQDFDVLCKSRPDILFMHESGHYLADLKTTGDASPRAFERSIYDYGYHIQAAMQQEAILAVSGVCISDFYFIIVEKTPPFATAIYQLEEEAIEFGRQEFKTFLKLYTECKTQNKWQSYPIQKIGLPRYAYYH